MRDRPHVTVLGSRWGTWRAAVTRPLTLARKHRVRPRGTVTAACSGAVGRSFRSRGVIAGVTRGPCLLRAQPAIAPTSRAGVGAGKERGWVQLTRHSSVRPPTRAERDARGRVSDAGQERGPGCGAAGSRGRTWGGSRVGRLDPRSVSSAVCGPRFSLDRPSSSCPRGPAASETGFAAARCDRCRRCPSLCLSEETRRHARC